MNAYYGKITGGIVRIFKRGKRLQHNDGVTAEEDKEVTDKSVLRVALSVLLTHPGRDLTEIIYGNITDEGNKLIDDAVAKAGGITTSEDRREWERVVQQTLARLDS